MKTITVHVNGPKFTAGPSVVVIWPMTIATDSLSIGFEVTYHGLGVDETGDKEFRVFVNGNGLSIAVDNTTNGRNEIQLRRVRISDINGRIISDQHNPSNNIPLPEMNTGIYFAEITYQQNQRKVFIFYK